MFEIKKRINKTVGRTGALSTPHGEILTPSFVPVGTKATVKSLTPEQVKEAKSQAVLANTYHLYLEPGEKIIKESGGLGKFMNWSGPTMTDSGGFQAFSLGVAYGHGLGKFISADIPTQETIDEIENPNHNIKKARPTERPQSFGRAKVTEEGVEFRSIIDGSKHFLSPEKSIQIQNDIGADIIFALDEFTSPHAPVDKIRSTIERTERWAKRCLDEFKKRQENIAQKVLARPTCRQGGRGSPSFARPDIFSQHFPVASKQYLFGIVQGGRYEELRKLSANQISRLDFDGYGIGGTFVKEDVATAVRWVNEILPEEKPRHLLGVGEPVDMILGVENGCDTFDCVAATRIARNGQLYTSKGKINILNTKYRNLLEPIEEGCRCYTCQNYSCAYIAHLFRAKEMLAATLASIHNIYFLNNLMSQVRESILEENFSQFKQQFLDNYKI